MSGSVVLKLTPGAPVYCVSSVWIAGQFIISSPLHHPHTTLTHTPQTYTEHTPRSHLSPPSSPRIQGPFITSPAPTVTDGSARRWHCPSQRLIWPQRRTDSWSNMSSGAETAAINNLRHMICTQRATGPVSSGRHAEAPGPRRETSP